MVIFLLEDFGLFLVKINHLLLTSDPKTNANKLWITLWLDVPHQKQQLPQESRPWMKTYLSLSMASTAPCLCSSNFGGGGSFPSPPPLFSFALPSFFFFPGITHSLFDGCSATTIHHTQKWVGGASTIVGKPTQLRMRSIFAQHGHKDRRKWRPTQQEDQMALPRKD